MTRTIRLFLLFEAVTFAVAASIHSGLFIAGDHYAQAAIPESVIAGALVLGFGLTWVWETKTRATGLAAQAFALLGTLVGLLTIAAGVGPRTVPDVAYHFSIAAVLVWGLVVAARPRAGRVRQRPVAQPWAAGALLAVTCLVLLLVFCQAVLGGEWLVGHSALIRLHGANAFTILILSLLQVVLAALAVGRRLTVLGTSALFLLLVVVQVTLGYAGSDTANQARALHIANGMLIFGLALVNVYLARRLGSAEPAGSAGVVPARAG